MENDLLQLKQEMCLSFSWTAFYFNLLMLLFHTVFVILSCTWLIAGSILDFISQNSLSSPCLGSLLSVALIFVAVLLLINCNLAINSIWV